jgi:hypothetical protein
MKPSEQWIAEERRLWDQLMGTRSYQGMSQAEAAAKSWAFYERWIRH